MSTPEFVLASGSPRRKQLLDEAGYVFRVERPDDSAECGICSQCGPAELVVDLARAKADDVAPRVAGSAPIVVMLAADTVAECGGMILGKPTSDDHARDMLTRMSGREHRVYTGFDVREFARGRLVNQATEFVVTTLVMDKLVPAMLDDYIDSGAWEGKAGAFGYQDGLDWVHIVEGSKSNVVGLPIERLTVVLANFGVRTV